MRVIHVLRKPLSEGTVASNVLKYGCGGLNIDASRIGSGGDKTEGGCAGKTALHDGGIKNRTPVDQSVGRWPANVILQHLDGCRCDGVKRVRGSTGGKWVCEPGCPVARLDEQSGMSKSTPQPRMNSAAAHNRTGSMGKSVKDWVGRGHDDAGGASRFYKQVGGSSE